MEILSLSDDREAALGRAASELRGGRLVVIPTDTVYGVAADAFNAFATAMVFAAKSRPRTLPLPILVAKPRDAWALTSEVPPAAAGLASAFWPGALTLVLPQAEGLEWDIGEGGGTVAVRIPDHPDTLDLLNRSGPLAVTSANRYGEPTPPTAARVAERLGHRVSVYLDGGPSRGDVPSTIVDLSGDAIRVVREGVIPRSEIERVARTVA